MLLRSELSSSIALFLARNDPEKLVAAPISSATDFTLHTVQKSSGTHTFQDFKGIVSFVGNFFFTFRRKLIFGKAPIF
jgi:hypothetical protein